MVVSKIVNAANYMVDVLLDLVLLVSARNNVSTYEDAYSTTRLIENVNFK